MIKDPQLSFLLLYFFFRFFFSFFFPRSIDEEMTMLETGRDDTRHWQKRLIQSESIPSSRHWINTGRKTKIVRFEANVSTWTNPRTKGRIKILLSLPQTSRPNVQRLYGKWWFLNSRSIIRKRSCDSFRGKRLASPRLGESEVEVQKKKKEKRKEKTRKKERKKEKGIEGGEGWGIVEKKRNPLLSPLMSHQCLLSPLFVSALCAVAERENGQTEGWRSDRAHWAVPRGWKSGRKTTTRGGCRPGQSNTALLLT